MSQGARESHGVRFCALLQCHLGSTWRPLLFMEGCPLARTGCSVWVLIVSGLAGNQSRLGLSPLSCPLPGGSSQTAADRLRAHLENCIRGLSRDGFPSWHVAQPLASLWQFVQAPEGRGESPLLPAVPGVGAQQQASCLAWGRGAQAVPSWDIGDDCPSVSPSLCRESAGLSAGAPQELHQARGWVCPVPSARPGHRARGAEEGR